MDYIHIDIAEDDARYIRKVLAEKAQKHRDEALYCEELANIIQK